MNNPGIDFEIWKQLRKKWTDLDEGGHKINVEFKLIKSSEDENKILVIDVIQIIDNEIITDTVQHIAKEAYAPLGIANASMEHLVQAYKETMDQLHRKAGQGDATLVVIMVPTSPTSGEVKASLQKKDSNTGTSIQVNYRHYYILNAMREKMIEAIGDSWREVKAVYRPKELEFFFEY
jgi:hypothetical protein